MDVAVAQVAEGDGADAGQVLFHQPRRPGDEVGDPGNGHGDIQLDAAPFVFLGLGQGLADAPQVPGLGFAAGDHGVGDDTVLQGLAEDALQGLAQGLAGPGAGQLEQRVIGMGRVHGVGHPGHVLDREVEADAGHHLERRQGVAAGGAGAGEQLQNVVRRRRAGEGGFPDPRPREKFKHGGRDDAQGALGADEQVLQVIARVVLAQGPEAVPNAPVGQHHFEPQHQVAGVAVAQHRDAAGVGRDVAADAAASLGGQAEGEQGAGVGGRRLHVGQHAPRLHAHRVVEGIDGADAVQPCRRQHDAAVRHAAADEPGVAALGHHGDAGLGAQADHVGHGLRRRRADDGGAGAPVEPPLLDEVGLHRCRVVDPAAGAGRLADGPEHVFRYVHGA